MIRCRVVVSDRDAGRKQPDFPVTYGKGDHREVPVAFDILNLMKSSEVVPSARILVVRWIYGKRERDEITAIRKNLGRRVGIRSVRARHKEQVYEYFESWLKTPDA